MDQKVNKKLSLYFVSERKISVEESNVPTPRKGEVLVQSIVSSISAGTEMLAYRNQLPSNILLDENIPCLTHGSAYPLQYGYSVVGKVIACGEEVSSTWVNRPVFVFHPHESHFLASIGELLPIPPDISPEDASFLPNVETAVNLTMDGRPIVGEKVAVVGQGVVGLLTTAILALMPLSSLLTFDKYPLRRKISLELGAKRSLDPVNSKDLVLHEEEFEDTKSDLTFELSGNPSGLELAIRLTGYSGRIVIGSWYGNKKCDVDLGGRFHRERIRIISSQVSTVNPEFLGRWDKSRRLEVSWDIIRRLRFSRLVTHRFPISQAESAYRLLDKSGGQTIQVLFTYPAM